IYVKDSDDIIKAFKVILFSYLILTILAVLAIPAARSGGQFMWRGFTTNKNVLGQIGFLSVILSYIIYKKESAGIKKTFALCMIFLAVIITIGSQSSTSFLIVVLLGGLGAISLMDSLFASIKIGKTISVISITSLFSLILGIMIVSPDLGTLLPELFGKDITFSGRTFLWEFLIDIGNDHPMLGTGYGAFWIPESERISSVHDVFTFLPGQAHNGYLDIFLASGYVGVGLLLLMLINYFLNLRHLSKPHPWILFIVAVFVANFQESSLLRTGHQVNFFFMFAYLLAFVDRIKNFNWAPERIQTQEIKMPVENKINRFKRVT
ncbi:MAG TPA: O-antigen ligase family protein, partial [Ignavibacteriaceae bacterium]